jgi:hypothetical protein
MTMPVMEPDLDAALLRTWARAIDEGPFSSLCWGERIAFGNPDRTDRVRLVTTVIVPQLRYFTGSFSTRLLPSSVT